MIKTVKRIIGLCVFTSLLAFSFTSCKQPTTPEIKQSVSPIVFSLTSENLVELSTNTKDAAIFYTLDGKEVTVDSTKYTEPFSVAVIGRAAAVYILEQQGSVRNINARYE